MREIKFEYMLIKDGIVINKQILTLEDIEQKDSNEFCYELLEQNEKVIKRQYTGLKDKNGVEIYEHMELDNQFKVSFNQGSYILTNISNGDIMTLHKYIKDKNGQVKITREYTKI